ncbi:NAD(P)-dependent oxidoreductase [Streptomyces sp. LX-29]|uniref:NAD-dependent epimerase/dehydratase family protein n=1 Tax=Streptomyces sp. LX-29 TaxID=2900152 RepID=UPI00240CEC62|nr:NAD(P)-dependent oxidoreductase [Streptomyces sp. LX-29]WFB05967.1 NAD(P)-dependent oxidoreductase [Streptomyces sp. LX-29]
MRVLLAGATGAIGRPLVRALTGAGHQVTAIVRDPTKHDLVRSLGAEPVAADVMRREELLRALDGMAADAVLHEATALRGAAPRLRADDPTNALRRDGTANLLAAARVVGAGRFVTQSMILGYGYVDHGDRVLTEADSFGEPRGSYADSVAAGCRSTERQVFAAGIEGIALRYGLFHGPGAFSDLFADMMRKRRPCIPAGGGGTNCWIHVDDAAGATVAALERGRPGHAYNIVDGTPVTWRTFADTVAAGHATPRPRSIPRPLLKLAAPYLACLMADTSMRVSNAKARQHLGWQPAHRPLAGRVP